MLRLGIWLFIYLHKVWNLLLSLGDICPFCEIIIFDICPCLYLNVYEFLPMHIFGISILIPMIIFPSRIVFLLLCGVNFLLGGSWGWSVWTLFKLNSVLPSEQCSAWYSQPIVCWLCQGWRILGQIRFDRATQQSTQYTGYSGDKTTEKNP